MAEGRRKKRLAQLIPEIKNDTPEVRIPAAMQELVKRELSRRKLIEFVKDFHPRYKAGWVHYDICRRLEQFAHDVEAGKNPRLMILMPPRHGKSQLASKLYPAWHLGHYPHHEFIGCSYNVSLAMDFSREIRDIIRSSKYHRLFPETVLNPDFQAAESWRLKSPTGIGAGGYNAAGVAGGITGKGAHVLVIDDPIKNDEEADNPEHLQKVWDWYGSTAYTRLAPGGGVLLIQTPWSDMDPSGRIQAAMKDDPLYDQFEIVKYPAIAEEDETYRKLGDPLHPDRYDIDALLRIKRTLSPRHWSALYQQSPVSEEGAYFNLEMFVYRDETPDVESMYIYQAWDFAISEKAQNDYTVGVTMGVDSNDTVHVLEIVRMRTNDAAAIENAIIDMYSRYPSVSGFGVEDGQIWRTLKTGLKRRMSERRVYIPLDDKANVLRPVQDKLARARPLQARMQNRRVTFPRGKEWVDTIIKELTRFPAGAHDDIVDAMAWCMQLLLGKPAPRAPKPVTSKREKTVQEKLNTHIRGGRGGGHMSA